MRQRQEEEDQLGMAGYLILRWMVHCCCETKKVEEEEEEVPCWTLHLLLRRLVHHPLVENSGTPEQRTESSGPYSISGF
jgi:hypothetical protein